MTSGYTRLQLSLNDQGKFILIGPTGAEIASFDSQGNTSLGLNLHVSGNMQVDGIVTLQNNAGGFAKIDTGQTAVRIPFSRPYPEIPVVTVSVKNGQFVQYAYTNLTTEGFTIVLSEPTQSPVEFSWSAISIKDAQTTSN